MAIVPTNINYTYETMRANLHDLMATYPSLQMQNVGYSVLGRPLPVLRLRSRSEKSILCWFFSCKRMDY